MRNIYLLGFMGTGKTAVGKALAKRLSWKFLDLDDLIEEREGTKIVDIFAKKGEPYFRDVESQVLRETIDREDLVIACGGGIVLNEDNIKLIEDKDFAICLDAAPGVIYERTKKFAHRPLLNVENPQGRIKELLNKRAPFYAKVKTHIDTSDLNVEEVVDKIAEMIKG